MIEVIPMKAQVGVPVHFDAWQSFYGSYYLILNYTWSFFVNGTEVLFYTEQFDYTFPAAGDYQVNLTITTKPIGPGTSTASVTVVVTDTPPENLPPTALIGGIWGAYYVGWGVELYGWDSSDDLGIVEYNWTIEHNGTQVTQLGRTADYVFTEEGHYLITLTVTDYGGLTASDFKEIDVTHLPVAEAGPDQTVRVGDTVTLDGSGSDPSDLITDYTWTVVDFVPETYHGVVVNHTFLHAGDFTVLLALVDKWGNTIDDDRMTVHVLDTPNIPPIAEAGPDATIFRGTVYEFNASESTDDKPGLTFDWNFRYNRTYVVLFGERPSFKFDLPGRYVVTLTAVDAGGLSSSDTVKITVQDTNGSSSKAVSLGIPGIVLGMVAVSVVAAVIARKYRNRHDKHRPA